jgi:hypothetical protein
VNPIRTRLEDHFARRAGELVRELSDERGAALADRLEELETLAAEVASTEVRLEALGRRAEALGATGNGAEQLERLVVELERRERELADLRRGPRPTAAASRSSAPGSPRPDVERGEAFASWRRASTTSRATSARSS